MRAKEVKTIEEMKKELAEKREKFEDTLKALKEASDRRTEIMKEKTDSNDDKTMKAWEARVLGVQEECGEAFKNFEKEKDEIERLEFKIRIASKRAKEQGYGKD